MMQAGMPAHDPQEARATVTSTPTTDPVIITCALTGGIHGKEANENLPEQLDEIVEQGVAAWRAGAAVLHVHARDPDGSSTMDPAIYFELHERLCAETDAVVQLTTGGSPRLPVDERLNTVLLAPEMCSRINVSSMGATQLPITTTALAMGLHVRVGMEDNVFYRRGQLVHDNAELVARTVRIAHELDRRPASPEEARATFALRGRAVPAGVVG